jgi:hypothetical protein
MGHHEENSENSHLGLLRMDAMRAGEGTPEEENHLESCRHCRKMLDLLRATEASLRGSAPPVGPVPPEIDKVILDAYRRAVPPARKTVTFPAWRRWAAPAVGTAAAAALILALSGPVLKRTPSRDAVAPPQSAVEELAADQGSVPAEGDINGDGTVDILDAFRLARVLQGPEGTSSRADLNRDGRVDFIDVDAVARRAVAL